MVDVQIARIIAVDYDGCITMENAWPEVGQLNPRVIERLKREKAAGSILILWSCREGHILEDAIEACRAAGVEFDAVNDQVPEQTAVFGSNPHKIYATEYWDDRAVCVRSDTTTKDYDALSYMMAELEMLRAEKEHLQYQLACYRDRYGDL